MLNKQLSVYAVSSVHASLAGRKRLQVSAITATLHFSANHHHSQLEPWTFKCHYIASHHQFGQAQQRVTKRQRCLLQKYVSNVQEPHVLWSLAGGGVLIETKKESVKMHSSQTPGIMLPSSFHLQLHKSRKPQLAGIKYRLKAIVPHLGKTIFLALPSILDEQNHFILFYAVCLNSDRQ